MAKRRSGSYSTPRGSNSKKKQKCSERNPGTVIARSSPCRIMQATRNFTPEQCDIIRRNGFGGLLSLKCRKNPPHLLCHWLARHFNCSTSELIFSNGTIIPVTAKSVQHILGIPHGSRKVKRMDDDSVAFMKSEYCYDGLPPKISRIAKELSVMKKADDRFLRTFLLLAVSSFLCPTTSSRVRSRCFPTLVDISCVEQFDWCGFVLEELVSSIKRYNKRTHTIGGCLIFLAVHYLDHLDTGSYRVPDSIPRIGVWTTKVIEDVVSMDTISEADGVYGQRPMKAIVNNAHMTSGLKIPTIVGEGLTVEQFVSSHLAADCDPSVKDELCRVVNNFCTNATSHLSMFIGSFLRDMSGLISSPSNTSPCVCQKASRASSRGTNSVSEDEDADKYNTEDETSEDDVFVSDDASEDEHDAETSSSESYSDGVSDHDDKNEESRDENVSLYASRNELFHEKDGNTVCKQEVSEELFPEAPPGFYDIPRFKEETGSPASDMDLRQYTESKKFVAVPSGYVHNHKGRK